MGPTVSVLFLRDKNNEEYQKKLKVFKSCLDAGVEIPKEVDDYFGGKGKENNIEEPLHVDFGAFDYDPDKGYEIDVDDIPSGVKTIRFFVNYS